ncbi:HEAT repeat domain-containing protein [Trichocoleus sp. FACHB-90]|uniref:NACHT domain-containing protein n=1 Tax=Cyanophyceae TaxID=3028117 RepID=UPI001687766F|nr:HEAT repeat domain-containing protein [Trichocoleus sp. FACHB-90]MBD1925394.1 HEAT repeat domain-containing protein [Trichocoleus sp. FACHB-90]
MVGVDFSPYLKFVCTTPRYQETLSRYTVLEAQPLVREESGGREREEPRQQVEPFPVLEGLRKYVATHHHVLLSGKPGSGKSTTLKRLLLEMAGAAQEDDGQPIPVLVQLKSDRSILKSIQDEFEKGDLDWEVNEKDIKRLLRKKRLFLLLDGVNEIPSEELRRELQEFREDNPHTPMIFTTRDLAVGGDLGIEKKLEMRPLTDTQMREFVGKYLPEYGDLLLRQLQDRLREVAETPLLLKMLCEVFDPQTQQIPKSKGELFRAFDQKYNQHKQNPPVSGDFRRFQSEVLQHLAFEMVRGDREKPTEVWLTVARSKAERILEEELRQRGETNAPTKAKEWLEDLLEHHLLQVAADPRRIEFHHQLFQEYYAAEALLARVENRHPDVMDDERLQHFYLNYLKWTEPVALMVALLEDEGQEVRLVRLALDVDLGLGARLAGEVKEEFQGQTVELIAQLGLSKPLEAHLLGVSRSNMATKILCHLLKDPDSEVRCRAVIALKKIASKKTVPRLLELLKDPKSKVRSEAAQALGEIAPEEVSRRLIQQLENPNGSLSEIAITIEALGWIREETAIKNLFKLLEEPDLGIRGRVLDALGRIGSDKAIPKLLQQLKDPNDFVRRKAAEAIGQIGSEMAVPGLLQQLKDPNSIVRGQIAEALGKIGSEMAVPELLHQLEDSDSYVRWKAGTALAQIKSKLAVPGLLGYLEHPEPDVRGRAAMALGEIDREGTSSELHQLLLEDPDSEVRRMASVALDEADIEAIESKIHVLLQQLKLQASLNYLIREMHQFPAMFLGEFVRRIPGKVSAKYLPELLDLISTPAWLSAIYVLSNIQQNCQFYNYEIFRKQLPPVVNPQPSVATVTNNINSEFVQIIEENHGTVIGEQNLKATED